MLVVLSPAKKLDWRDRPGVTLTDPAFREDAASLAALARDLDPEGLQRLMGISQKLARLNAERFATFEEAPQPEALRPAALAFAGDTYTGLDAQSLDDDARRWAQEHLRILSGLYGILRPFDGIQPYRLEMGSRLANPRGRDLYAWWGDRLARALNETAAENGSDTVLNCASQEYFGAVDRAALKPRVVTPVFMEERDCAPRVVSFYAKQARGAMARFVCENRLTDPGDIRAFDAGGYRHAPEMSTDERCVFLRAQAAAA